MTESAASEGEQTRAGASRGTRIVLCTALLALPLVPAAYLSFAPLVDTIGLATAQRARAMPPERRGGASEAASVDATEAVPPESQSDPIARPDGASGPTILGRILAPEAQAATAPQAAATPRPADGEAGSDARTVWLFVQRPGVNIRSAPGRSGQVIATADKGMLFKVIGRSGSWVHVETEDGHGWISAQLLGSAPPQLADDPL